LSLSFDEAKDTLRRAQTEAMWPQLFIDSSATPERLYHYTTALGLHGILKSKTLWASDAHFLNDRLELVYGHELIRGFLTRQSGPLAAALLRGEPKDVQGAAIYVTSFCEQGDLLSQWRGYAHPEDGYSIAFQRPSLALSRNVFLIKVIYQRDEKERRLANLLRSLTDMFSIIDLPEHQTAMLIQQSVEVFWALSFCLKHESFSGEQEWRLVGGLQSQYVERFRLANGHFVPYIEIPFDTEGLVEIRQGPGSYRASNVAALTRLLRAENFPKTTVERSLIPL
jgi:hypothetical protein